MYLTITKRVSSAIAIAAVLTMLGSARSMAQQSAQASKAHWSVITVTSVKPDMQEQFEAALKEVTPAFKKAGVPARHVLQSVMGDAFEYVSIYPITSFADFETHPYPAEQSLGKEGWATLRGKLTRCAASIQRIAAMELEEPKIQTDTKEPAPYAMVQFMRTVPGKGPDLVAWLKNDYFPVMRKAEVKNLWVSRDVFGANPNEYVVVRPMNSLGEIDAGPLTVKVLGPDGANQLTAKTAGIVESVQFRIYRYRSDLSYQAAPNQTTASAR